MTKKEIREIALRQSAIDCGCAPEDFLQNEPVVVLSRADERARKYLPLPFECDLVSYGNNVVAQVSERLRAPVENFLRAYLPLAVLKRPICTRWKMSCAPSGCGSAFRRNISCRSRTFCVRCPRRIPRVC